MTVQHFTLEIMPATKLVAVHDQDKVVHYQTIASASELDVMSSLATYQYSVRSHTLNTSLYFFQDSWYFVYPWWKHGRIKIPSEATKVTNAPIIYLKHDGAEVTIQTVDDATCYVPVKPIYRREYAKDLSKRMKDWYGAKLARILRGMGKTTIDTFVVKMKFNIYIPDYVVVHSYHAWRYKQMQDLIMSLYNPDFIMTLPFTYRDVQYTVMFPVTERLTKQTFDPKALYASTSS